MSQGNMPSSSLDIKWSELLQYINNNFGGGEELDLQAVLFLIGINELGQGYREFTKEEKINLLHIAICKLLSRYGYYEYNGKDKEGWPHWLTRKKLQDTELEAQNTLLKESAIIYFDESNINYKQ